MSGASTSIAERTGSRERVAGVVLVAVSGASFGTLAIFARYAYRAGGEPTAVLFLRFTVAAMVLVAVLAVRREALPRGRALLPLVGLGAIGYVGQSLAYFTALTYASVALVSLLLYLFPVIVVLLSRVFLGERLTRVRGTALALALAGSALTVGSGAGGRPLGVVLGIVSAVLYALYIVIGSRVTAGVGAIPAATVIVGSAALSFGLVVLVTRPAFPHGALGAFAILGLALVATVVAIVTFFAGLARLGPTDSSTLSTFEPVVTVLLAATLLGERVTPLQLAGGALILGAVLLLARRR